MNWGRTLRRIIAGVVVAVAMFSSASLEIFSTSAQSSATLVGVSYPFTGASFSPEAAPVVIPTVTDGSIALTWPSVALSSNRTVSYSVTRTSSTGSVATVCTGASAPVIGGANTTCNDADVVAGTSYTYTEQPSTAVGAVTTWSRSTSSASTSITPPNWKFGQLGTFIVSTNNNAISLPIPNGTAVGDILLLVAVNANRNTASAPAGWTELVSVGVNSSPFSLFVAWRIADSATSVSLSSRATATGGFATVVNYGHAFSSTSTPVIAHTAVRSSSAAASTTFSPPTNITTNATAARALSIVAVRANNPISLSTSAGYTVRGAKNQIVDSGTTGLSLAIADTVVQTSGSTPTSPTWTQSGTAAQWISGLIAFA